MRRRRCTVLARLPRTRGRRLQDAGSSRVELAARRPALFTVLTARKGCWMGLHWMRLLLARDPALGFEVRSTDKLLPAATLFFLLLSLSVFIVFSAPCAPAPHCSQTQASTRVFFSLDPLTISTQLQPSSLFAFRCILLYSVRNVRLSMILFGTGCVLRQMLLDESETRLRMRFGGLTGPIYRDSRAEKRAALLPLHSLHPHSPHS